MEFINNLCGISAKKECFHFNKDLKEITITNDGIAFADLKGYSQSFKFGNGKSNLNEKHVGIKKAAIILGNCLKGHSSTLKIVTKDDVICQKAEFEFGYDKEFPINCIFFGDVNEEEANNFQNGTTFIIGNAEPVVFKKAFYKKFVKYINLMHSAFLKKNELKIHVSDSEGIFNLFTDYINEDGSIILNDRYNVEAALEEARSGKEFFEKEGIFYWYRTYKIKNQNGEEREIHCLYNFIPRSKYDEGQWKDVRKGYYLSMGGEIGYIDGVYVNMLNSLLNYYPETRTFNGKSEGFAYSYNTGGGDRSAKITILDNCRDILEVSSEKMKGLVEYPFNPNLEDWVLVDETQTEKDGTETEITLIGAFHHDFYKVLRYNKEVDAPNCADKMCDYFALSNINTFEAYIKEYDAEHKIKTRAKGKKKIKNIIEGDGEVIDVIDYNDPSTIAITTKMLENSIGDELFFSEQEMSALTKEDRKIVYLYLLAYERSRSNKAVTRDSMSVMLKSIMQILSNDNRRA